MRRPSGCSDCPGLNLSKWEKVKADLQNFPSGTSFLVSLEFVLNSTAGQMCMPHIIAVAVESYSYSLRAGRSEDRIPVGAMFSAHVHTGPVFHPTSYTMGTGSFPGVKRPGRSVDTHHHLAPKLKKE